MPTLDDTVLSVVRDFVNQGVMFTALDVSNKVKESMPHARHGEVRDHVRNLFSTEIEVNSYARTPIPVTLADGKVVEALLYHPLSDSWDLDVKYDAQKRSATSARPVAAAPVAVSAPAAVVAAPAPTPAPAPVKSPHDLWSQMFQTQPSLFARKSNV